MPTIRIPDFRVYNNSKFYPFNFLRHDYVEGKILLKYHIGIWYFLQAGYQNSHCRINIHKCSCPPSDIFLSFSVLSLVCVSHSNKLLYSIAAFQWSFFPALTPRGNQLNLLLPHDILSPQRVPYTPLYRLQPVSWTPLSCSC